MTFESIFGLGEICIYNDGLKRGDRMMIDHLVKIVAVVFEIGSETQYTVELATNHGIQRLAVHESSLVGDPDFDDETGYEE